MLLAIELVRDRATMERFGPGFDPADRLRIHGARHGLLLYARRQNAGRFGDWSTLAPPLVATEAELDELAERLERALADTAAEVL